MGDNIKAKMNYVSEKDGYLWAFLSLKCGLDLIDNLNEQYPKIIDSNAFSELKNKNLADQLQAIKDYKERLETVNEQAKKEGLKKVYVSLDPKKNEFDKIWYDGIVRQQSKNIIADMSLAYVVAIFEDFLQKVLLIAFKNKPEVLKSNKKSITYEELLNYGNIEEAKDSIIEKELLIVNEDIQETRDYIKNKFNIDISELVNWQEFKERFYRRNIIIHNSGMPNEKYRYKTGYGGANVRMGVSNEYLKNTVELLKSMSFKIKVAFEEKLTQ